MYKPAKNGWPARKILAGVAVGGRETVVRAGPNTGDAVTRADEDRGGSQGNECQQKGVLDKVLALLVIYEILHEVFHFVFSLSDELIRAEFPRYGECLADGFLLPHQRP